MPLCQQEAAHQTTSHQCVVIAILDLMGKHNLFSAFKNSEIQIFSLLGFVSCTDAMASFYSGGQDVRRPRR